jgi:hypothetical protein
VCFAVSGSLDSVSALWASANRVERSGNPSGAVRNGCLLDDGLQLLRLVSKTDGPIRTAAAAIIHAACSQGSTTARNNRLS